MIKSQPVRLGQKVVAEFPPYDYVREPTPPADPSVVDALRFGMPTLKTCAWAFVPESIRNQMMTIAAADPASHELEALIRRVPDDTPLIAAWAEVKSGPTPDVRSWAIANLWTSEVGSEGVILTFAHPVFISIRESTGLIAKLLEGLNAEGRPELAGPETVLYVSKRGTILRDQLVKHGFETVHTILP